MKHADTSVPPVESDNSSTGGSRWKHGVSDGGELLIDADDERARDKALELADCWSDIEPDDDGFPDC